jgi:hypothetical protein
MISKFSKNFFVMKLTSRKWVTIVALIIFIVGFVIGVIGIRYDYIKNTYYLLKDVPKIMNNLQYAFNRQVLEYEDVAINMKFKEYQIITNNRDRNIKEGHAVYAKSDWAKGNITFTGGESKLKAKFRLKGTMSDNWVESDGRWSFRVKLKGDQRYNGMKEFSLFTPSVGSGILEWLFQKVAKKEGLLTLRTKLVKLHLNGKYLGYYYLQEHYNKALVEGNKKREGPIVGYSKDRLVKLWYSDPAGLLSTNGFNTADIKLTGNYTKLKPSQKKIASYALGMLERLRDKTSLPSEIIDVDMMAKLLAIRAIIASSDLDWKDIKFYYNPLSARLEPIVREAHAEYDLYDWWYRGTRSYNSIHVGYTTFEDLIFSDRLIYGKYIEYLRKYTDINILELVKKNNETEYSQIISAMALSNDGEKWLERVHTRKGKIRAAFAHPDPVSINLTKDKNLNIRNYQSFPIVIKNIIVNGDKLYEDNIEFVAHGKINDEKYYDNLLKIPLNDMKMDTIEVLYSLSGDGNISSYRVRMYPTKSASKQDLDLYKKFFYIKDNTLQNRESITVIDSSVITPKEMKVVFSPGSTLTFQSTGQLISPGGIHLDGNKDSRIKVNATHDAKNGGILVSESSNISTIKYTDFSNLKGVFVDNKLISGSVNFYKTRVIIKDSTFSSNYIKDDYINIVNSNFKLSNIVIDQSNADSIDIDFSQGSIEGAKIYNSGNDGLDFSGSEIKLSNILIENAKDKAISVGEGSKIEADSVTVNNSFIGVAVKDGSFFEANSSYLNNNKFDYVSFIKKPEYGTPELNIIKGEEKFSYLLGEKSKIRVNGNLVTEVTDNIKELLY